MNVAVISIFPELIRTYLGESLIGKATQRGLFQAQVLDLRSFATDRHHTVDDSPYGGGPGMVMKTEPFERAIQSVLSDGKPTMTMLMSPQGKPLTQARAEALAREPRRLLFLCGRYEGIDERVIEEYVDEEYSIGDYVLSGGELAALVIIEAALRLVPGVVGDDDSLRDESFSWGILDYPHYTRPEEWRGRRVPDVLMSGNHREIDRFRRREALRRTLERRPDLLDRAELSIEDRKMLENIKTGLHEHIKEDG